ncbi:MAG: hypothetical protein ACREMA_00295 [Longimicrobiales bacterium]
MAATVALLIRLALLEAIPGFGSLPACQSPRDYSSSSGPGSVFDQVAPHSPIACTTAAGHGLWA